MSHHIIFQGIFLLSLCCQGMTLRIMSVDNLNNALNIIGVPVDFEVLDITSADYKSEADLDDAVVSIIRNGVAIKGN